MKNIKIKKALAAIGAVMALGFAGQSMAVTTYPDGLDPAADTISFNADMNLFCAAQPQPAEPVDPSWQGSWDSSTGNCNAD